MRSILLLLITIFLELYLVQAQAPAEARFYMVNTGMVSVRNGTSFNYTCSVKFPTTLTVAGDGKLWGTYSNTLLSVDPETRRCAEYNMPANIQNPIASPSGKHVYFLMLGEVYRRNLLLNTIEKALPMNNGFPYMTFAFLGSRFMAVRRPNVTIEYYRYDKDTNLVLDSISTEFSLRIGITPNIVKKCPVPDDVFCYLSISENIQRSTSVPGQLTKLTDLDFLNMGVEDYFTAPWIYLYVSFMSKTFGIAITDPTIYPLPYYEKTEVEGTLFPIVALLNPPQLSIAQVDNGCKASVQFKSYAWTLKYIVQVMDPITQLFEDYHVETSPTEGPQDLQLDFTCQGSTARFRLYWEGNMSISDPVYSLSTTVNCNCPIVQPPVRSNSGVPNVVPILECVEVTNGNPVVHLGYNNLETSVANIAVGSNNRFSDVESRNQPVSFAVGRTSFYPASAFSFAFDGSVAWTLSTYALNIDTSDTSTHCPQSVSFALSFTSETVVTAADVTSIQQDLATMLEVNSSRITVIEWSSAANSKKRAAFTVEIRFQITVAAQGSSEPSPATLVRSLMALLDESPNTFDQLLGNGRAMVSLTPLPTGREQEGTDAQVPAAPNASVSSGSFTLPAVLTTLGLAIVTL